MNSCRCHSIDTFRRQASLTIVVLSGTTGGNEAKSHSGLLNQRKLILEKSRSEKYVTTRKYVRIPNQLAFMPHDKSMVIFHEYPNASHRMALRDSETGQFIRAIKFPTVAGVHHKITSVGNSKDQMLLSVVSSDNRLLLFDPVRNIIRKTFKETASEVTAACFSDDAKLFAFCLDDGTVQIYDVENDKQVSSFQVQVTKSRAAPQLVPARGDWHSRHR